MTENILTHSSFRLDSSQRKAANHLQGPVRIEAGPGSGKTATLVARTLMLVDSGVPPDKILLITFTRKAAQEMRTRLQTSLEELPTIGTFHSVCLALIREHPVRCGFRRGVSVVNNTDQKRMLRGLCEEHGIRKTVDINAMIRTLNTVRSLYAASKDGNAANYISEHVRDEHGAPLSDVAVNTVLTIWKAYARLKRSENVVDLIDCVPVVLTTLKRYKEFAAELALQYRYIFVDEAQDMDHNQYELVCAIGTHRNIALVADINQSIYGWRGSDPTLLRRFDDEYGATVIRLERNYRSAPAIVQASNKLIRNNLEDQSALAFSASNTRDIAPRVIKSRTWPEMMKLLMANIASDLVAGVPLSEIAVLYRSGPIKKALGTAFESADVPFRWLGGNQTSTPAEINAFLAVVRLHLDDTSFAAFYEIGDLCGVAKPLLQKAVKYCQKANADANSPPISVFDACHRIRNKNMATFAEMIRSLLFDFAHEKPSECFQWLRSHRLYRQWMVKIMDSQRSRASPSQKHAAQAALLDNYETIFERFFQRERSNAMDDTESYLALTDMEFLDGCLEEDDTTALSLGTIHRAKGLEWQSVHLIAISESVLPSYSQRRPLTADALLEERRVCFVGVTRAKQYLRLYHSDQLDYGQYAVSQLQPSRFIREMASNSPGH